MENKTNYNYSYNYNCNYNCNYNYNYNYSSNSNYNYKIVQLKCMFKLVYIINPLTTVDSTVAAVYFILFWTAYIYCTVL